MRHVCLGAGIVMLAASSTADAAPICTYGVGYSDPYIHGPCFVDAVEGCPLHVVLPHQDPPVELMPIVYRGDQMVTVTSTTSVVGAVDASIPTIAYDSCYCERGFTTVQFDEIAVAITGAQAGDMVTIDDGEITIAPAATCQPPDWPTQFDVQLGGCDPCPIDSHGDSGACTTTTSSSLMPVLLALALALTRVRRAGSARRD